MTASGENGNPGAIVREVAAGEFGRVRGTAPAPSRHAEDCIASAKGSDTIPATTGTVPGRPGTSGKKSEGIYCSYEYVHTKGQMLPRTIFPSAILETLLFFIKF